MGATVHGRICSTLAAWRRGGESLAATATAVLRFWRGVRERLLALRRPEPLPSRPLVVVAACLAAGCVAGRWVPLGHAGGMAWWLGGVAAVAGWAVAARAGRPRRAAGALAAAIACGAAAWSAVTFDLFRDDDLAWRLTSTPVPVAVTGVVEESFRLLPAADDDPARRAAIGPASECLVRIESVRIGSRWRPATGRAAVVVDGDPPPLRVGDRIRVLGRGLRPRAAGNPGEFDFRLRARSRRSLSIVRASSARCIRVVREAWPWMPWAAVDSLRQHGVAVLEAHVAAARAPLAAALLLGSRESLPREHADDFLATGTVHILSISGLHVGLLALGLFAVCRTLAVPRGWALAAVAAVVGAYMLLVRAETPVLRATLVIWLACLAAAVSRRSPAINALAAAAIVVLVWRPAEVFSAGAQLSFLSTAVLVGVAAALPRRTSDDPIDRLIDRSRSPAERWARHIGWQTATLFLAGAAVWVATAPLVLARFHVCSPVGLVVNVVVAPLVAVAMAAGFLCLLAAPVSTLAAGGCGAVCDGALACLSFVVRVAADVTGGHWWTPGPPAWWVAGWYLLLAVTLLWLPPAVLCRGRTWACLAGAWVAVWAVAAGMHGLVGSAPAGMRVVAAAVGHGCGIVVISPEGRCLVFDAGRLGAAAAARRSIAAVLWSEGHSRIDTLVISHADADHFNAVPELMERFAVGEVMVPVGFAEGPSMAVAELMTRIRRRGIPVRQVVAGESFAIDRRCRVRVLHPVAGAARTLLGGDGAAERRAADNEAGIVMAVEAAGRRLLLTGDIEGPAAAAFVAGGPDACDVLVAPHHGSRTSLPPGIAAATQPAAVLVSGQGNESWGDVRAAYATVAGIAEANVLQTGDEGAIALGIDAVAVTASRFADGAWRRLGPLDRPPAPPHVTLPPVGAVASARPLPR